ncbi:hypothetical protein M404DRAFT_1005416 [Pisolithus tinctorius Marx 270]|uniref:Uncharacterized protein n=1 Tax=Pisolithus tinctorius Marx 270 TaxID=870435 RepID=A0A0C3NB13_PISTI|nr:hypothetical protein M404DRAFT_1005416 [Pisolithus tinctorius Marx 270]
MAISSFPAVPVPDHPARPRSQSMWQSLPQLMRRSCQCKSLPQTTLNRMDAQLVSAPHLSHGSFVSVQLNPPQYDSTPRLTSFSLR